MNCCGSALEETCGQWDLGPPAIAGSLIAEREDWMHSWTAAVIAAGKQVPNQAKSVGLAAAFDNMPDDCLK